MNLVLLVLAVVLLRWARAAPRSVVPWASCATDVIRRSAATVRHQLNAYVLEHTEPQVGYFERDLLDTLLPGMQVSDPFSVNLAPYQHTVDYNQRNLVLIMLPSLSHLEVTGHLAQLVDKNVERRGYFLLLVASTWKQTEIDGLFERLWYYRMHNVLLALEQGSGNDEEEIVLVGYQPYGPAGCCGCARALVVGRCRAGQLSVAGSLYDRFERNLHGCQLRIAAFDRPPFMTFYREGHQLLFEGIEGNLLELLAERLNFTIAIVPTADGHGWGRIYPNGTATGTMALLLAGDVHLTLGRHFPYPRLLTETTQSHSYYIADLVLAVPEALVPATPVEQLLKPFQWHIWLLLALELLIGFGVTICGRLGRPSGRPLALELWRIFLGASLPTVPRTFRARYALLLWLLHTTLLRECYKGGLVRFLTEPTPLNDIHSIDALLATGYRFAMTETVYHKVFDGERTSARIGPDRLRLVQPGDEAELLRRTIRDGAAAERLAIASTREEIVAFNGRNRSAINYRTSDEKLLTFHFSMYFKRSSPVVGAFDWYIQRCLSTGHISRWHAAINDPRFLRPTLTDADEQAEVLRMRHLASSYMLLVAGLAVACVAFTLELLRLLPVPTAVDRVTAGRISYRN